MTTFSRWHSFCVICLYLSFTGTVFTYNIYGEILKTELGYSQSTVSIIASIGYCGTACAILVGFGIERFGNRCVLYGGSICVLFGYLYMYLSIVRIVYSNVASITFSYFVAQIGTCCFVGTAITSTVNLFPTESRGTAIGLCRAYFGLSSAVLGDLAGGVFRHRPADFVLFVAVVIPTLGILGAHLSSALPPHLLPFDYERCCDVDTSFRAVLCHWNALLGLLFAVGCAQYSMELSRGVLGACSACVVLSVLVLLLLPSHYGPRVIESGGAAVRYKSLLSAPQEGEPILGGKSSQSTQVSYSAIDAPAIETHSAATTTVVAMTRVRSASCLLRGYFLESGDRLADYGGDGGGDDGYIIPPPPPASSSDSTVSAPRECFYGASLTVREAARTWRYWALFAVFLALSGSALLVIFNGSDIAQSAGGAASPLHVTVFALGSGLGKIAAGTASDHHTRRGERSPLELLGAVCVFSAVVHLLLSVGRRELLVLCFLGVGLASGCAVSLVSVATADIFGPRHVATTLALMDTAPLVGSFLFSVALVAVFYRPNASSPESGLPICVGAQCFRWPLLVSAACCVVCAGICGVLHAKTKTKTKGAAGNRNIAQKWGFE